MMPKEKSHRGFQLSSGVLGASICLAAGMAFAQEPEKAFLEELPVVLSASRLPQSLADTPGAVTIIDRELIRATGYRDIPRLLRLVPGFTIVQSRGHSSQVSDHGLAGEFPNRMQVLIDGRSVYSPYFTGGVAWASLPITIEEIERIEVLRGSNSATYGSNAFLGVVNIVTRHSAEDQGTAAWAAGGSTRIGDLGFKHGGQTGDLSYRVSLQTNYDRGFENLYDSWKGQTLTVRGDYRLRADDELTFLAGVHEGTRGYGFGGNPANTNGERDAVESTGFANIRWRRQLGVGSEFSAGYYRNIERAREEWNVFLPPVFPVVGVDSNRRSTRDNLDVQHNFTLSSRLRGVWGAEVRSDTIESARFFSASRSESVRLFRLYANAEWRPLAALVVNGGAMLEEYSGKQAKLAPRLFANWHANDSNTVRVGGSRAFRAPSLFEERGDTRFFSSGTLLQQTFTPAGTLLPERIDAAEIGYLGRFPSWKGTVDVRLYREKIADLIVVRPVLSPLVPSPLLTPITSTFANDARTVLSRGIETQVRVSPLPGTDLLLGYAHMKIRSGSEENDRSVPRNSGSLTWIQKYPGNFGSTLTLRHVGAYTWGSGGLPVQPYSVADLRFSYRTSFSSAPAEFALVLLNQGRPHDEFTFQGAPDRSIVSRQAFLTVRIGF